MRFQQYFYLLQFSFPKEAKMKSDFKNRKTYLPQQNYTQNWLCTLSRIEAGSAAGLCTDSSKVVIFIRQCLAFISRHCYKGQTLLEKKFAGNDVSNSMTLNIGCKIRKSKIFLSSSGFSLFFTCQFIYYLK